MSVQVSCHALTTLDIDPESNMIAIKEMEEEKQQCDHSHFCSHLRQEQHGSYMAIAWAIAVIGVGLL